MAKTTCALHRPYRALVWGLVALALAVRVYHYLRNPPVWCDELWLLRNIVGKTFAELLGPLGDMQAAPPLFLWVEHVVWLLFGPGIYALRLLPLLASCGTVLLLVPLGRRCLRPAALPWAILLLGFSDPVLDYSCEVKPYVIDAFLGAAVPALFCVTRRWRLPRRLTLFAALAPLVIFLSYPGGFIYGGLLLALLPSLWQERRDSRAWLAYAALVLCTFAAFALLVTGPVRAQRTAALEAVWIDYPDWDRPWAVPLWSAEAFVRLLEHLWRPTGGALILPAALGAMSLWRRRRRAELLALGLPVLLALPAAWLRAYPFESRLILYAAAPLTLLVGEGVAAFARRLRHWLGQSDRVFAPRRRAALGASLGLLYVILLVPLSRTVYHLVTPMPRLTEQTWPEAQARVSGLAMRGRP
jgi:hypothetical protein